MPAGLITRPISDNRLARETMGRRLPATLTETLGATFDDPLLSPTELGEVELELRRADPEDRRLRGGILGVDVQQSIRDITEPRPDLVPQEKLNQEFGELGLNFDQPRSREYAQILAKAKREELIRDDIISRGPTGVLPTTLKFGAALASAALDPLNIASAFVPVVREARFAGMVAKLGKTNARLLKGFTEGTIGSAAIELPVFQLATSQQRDYEMSDALLNVALGGFLGGGLHAIGGKLADVIESRSPKVREEALKSAVAHIVEGKTPNVEPIFRFDEATFTPVGGQRASFRARSTQALQGLRADLTGLAGEKLSRGEVQALETQIKDIESNIKRSEESFQDVKKAVKREKTVRGRQAGPEAERRIQEEIAALREPLEAARQRLERHQRAAKAESTLSRVEQRVIKGDTPETILNEERKRLQQDLPDMDTGPFRVEIPAFNEDFIRPMTMAELRQEAANRARSTAQAAQAQAQALPEVTEVAQQAAVPTASEKQKKVVATKKGPITLTNVPDARYPEENSRIVASTADGLEVGILNYSSVEQDGLRFNPSVEVVPDFRRAGVASAMYDFAEELGGLIPAVEQAGQSRSIEGQAFRVGREAKKALVEIPAFNEDFIRPMTMAELRQEAANVAKAEADPKRDITADFEASARADDTLREQVGESAEVEAEFAQEGIEALRAADLLTKEEKAELEQLAQFTQRAAEYERGVKAAARCLSR